MARKIRRGDRVIVISGSNRGQVGNVLSVQGDRAQVDGVNIMIKHVKKKEGEAGRIEQIVAGIHLSNLSHVDKDDKPVKTSFLIRDTVKYLVQRGNVERVIRKV